MVNRTFTKRKAWLYIDNYFMFIVLNKQLHFCNKTYK